MEKGNDIERGKEKEWNEEEKEIEKRDEGERGGGNDERGKKS